MLSSIQKVNPVQTLCFRPASEHVHAAETNETDYFLADWNVCIRRDREVPGQKATADVRDR